MENIIKNPRKKNEYKQIGVKTLSIIQMSASNIDIIAAYKIEKNSIQTALIVWTTDYVRFQILSVIVDV